MSKIKCPKCGNEFEIDQAQYADFNNAVNKAVKDREAEIRKNIELVSKQNYDKQVAELTNKITELKGKLDNAENEKQLKVKEALETLNKSKQSEIDTLKAQLDKATDYKLRMNVKDIGEDLEQYCENKFNAIRANTYPNAYFEKDSDTKINNEKGDYIFRDYVGEGDEKTEFISIMFDMKNEDDTAKTKHKNEDYFKKLDSDRKAKGCEYAVLVSMLEIDNELYNQGIVDVSYKYPKMFVVRPQHFLTIIALLRSAALTNAKDKLEVVKYQQQNLDVSNFEQELANWKENWGKNIDGAKKHFEKTIDAIDASIKNMQKIRDELTGTVKQLGYADNKVEELTLRKLAKNSPTIKDALKKK